MTTIAVTGHRPDKLGGYAADAQAKVLRFAMHTLKCAAPVRLKTGMALGWDQACAQAAVSLGIPFDAYLPFVGQELVWSAEFQSVYHDLLTLAASVIVVCKERTNASYLRRNVRMVHDLSEDTDDALLALWDGSGGGTAHCWSYAEGRHVQRANLWNEWRRFEQGRKPLVTRTYDADHWVKRFVDKIHERNR
jgi:uncharacterized phage-like protein YoqJ